MILNLFVIGLIAIISVTSIWYLYKYVQNKYPKKPVILLNEPVILSPEFGKSLTPSQFPLPDPNKGDILGLTYGFKLFVEAAAENEDWGRRYDQLKPLIKFNPGVYYHPSENYLQFSVKVKDSKYTESIQTLKIRNVPVQKWTRVIVVYSSNRIKVYFNQKLVGSRKLKNPPILETDYMRIGEENNNIKGILGPVLYWPYPLEDHLINLASEDLI